jgi:hypothetical protein
MLVYQMNTPPLNHAATHLKRGVCDDSQSANVANSLKANTCERNSAFELLRIICILFVVAGHMWMGHKWNGTGTDEFIKLGLRPLFMVAVNCFVLVSGWFGITLKWQKLWRLNTMTTFWTVVLAALAFVCGVHTLDIRHDILLLFPVLTKQYWFITVYFVLCILSPALNVLVEHLDKEAFRKLLLYSFILFVLLPTIAFALNFNSITEDAGYGIVNFMFLYLLGRYLRKHYKSRRNKYLYLVGYFLATLCCGVVQIIFSRVLGFEFTSFISYDTVFVFLGAVFLFLFFTRVSFTSPIVNRLATFCLATYVIHIHPLWFKYLYQEILQANVYHGGSFLLFVVSVSLLTFLTSVVLEYARQLLFRLFSGGATMILARR